MRELRKGFSTGAAAAAATKAAAHRLLGTVLDQVDLNLTNGIGLVIPISNSGIGLSGEAFAEVVKDGGDDPDVTNGIVIKAVVRKIGAGVKICGGKGVGRVTKPGLPIEPGEPAINPVPRRMIETALNDVTAEGGWEVTIEVPEGERVATKTLNPRLGIIGGISILGTTGIVEPMSEEAWRLSLASQLSIIKALGHRTIVLTPGRQGASVAINSGIPEDQVAEMSNFVGYLLDKCFELGFASVILWGHYGKLLKVAAGNFQTHNRVSDGRLETLAALAAVNGVSTPTVAEILQANTTEEAVNRLTQLKLDRIILNQAAERISRRAQERASGLSVGAVLTDRQGSVRGIDPGAYKIIEAEQWKMNW